MKNRLLSRKSNFSQPISWISVCKNAEIQLKRAFSYNYSNLFAYAANNPVKYTDPDGNEVASASFWTLMSSFTSGIDRFTSLTLSAVNGNSSANVQLNSLSHQMKNELANAAGEAVVCGMEFMAENGSTIALVAYASGNVGLGAIIDGVTVACDVTLAYNEYKNTGDSSALKKSIGRNVASVAVGFGISKTAINSYNAAFRNLPDSFTEKALDTLSNMLGEYAGMEAANATETIIKQIDN